VLAGPPNAKRATSKARAALVKLEVDFDHFGWGCSMSPDLADSLADTLKAAAREARANAVQPSKAG